MTVRHPAKDKNKQIVLIVGGGFAGLNAAKELAGNSRLHVILVDQRNHHLFQPLLYQVATAGLSPGDIAVPIRAQFSKSQNIEVHLGKVRLVNTDHCFVEFAEQTALPNKPEQTTFRLEFDYLILACGTLHSYFKNPEWEEFAPGLKTLEQATEIRRRILLAFEHAENELDPEVQKSKLNFVIVGGGPTGVELAGAIADISRTVIQKDFRRIDSRNAQIILVEAGPRILSSFDEKLSARAMQDLKELGVQVRTSSRVQNINARGVQIGSEFIISENVFWAAGVRAASIALVPEAGRDSAGRILVNQDFSIPQNKNIFVVGDMAAFPLGNAKWLPGLAPAAIQAGKFAARCVLRDLKNKPRESFKYLDKGQMATIGKYRAIAQSGPLKLTGYLAWLAWIFIHVIYLVGFKNRVAVIFQWIWSYLFSKRGARLITDKNWKLSP